MAVAAEFAGDFAAGGRVPRSGLLPFAATDLGFTGWNRRRRPSPTITITFADGKGIHLEPSLDRRKGWRQIPVDWLEAVTWPFPSWRGSRWRQRRPYDYDTYGL